MSEPTATTKATAANEDVPARAGLVLTALVCAALVCNINIAAANVALPDIGEAFAAPQTLLNLVGVGAGLGLSMSVLYFGALADRYGRKQLLLLGLSLTILASVLSSLSVSVEMLVVARIATGVAAGMAFPTTLSLITALWAPGPRRTGAIAVWSSVSGMASVLGAILAGLLLVWFWWGSVFLLCIPFAIVAIILVVAVVPAHVEESTEPVDHLGGVLSVVGIAALVLGVSFAFAPGAGSFGLTLLALAVAGLALFGWRQARAANPLFDLRVARRRLFWVPAIAGAIVFGSLIGSMFVGEQFTQNILGYSALQAGLSVVPAAIGLILMAPLSAWILTHKGTRAAMLVGYACVFVGFLTMLSWREGSPYPVIGFGFFIVGCGASFVTTASSRSLTSSTPVRRVGMASATSDLQSDLGGSLMQALLGAVLATGFAGSFGDRIANSGEASSISDTVTRALQASFGSALHVAEQYPKYHDAILEAARQSLVSGALAAYLIGAIMIVAGIVLVVFALPSRAREADLSEQYSREDQRETASTS